jgi:hypothetical protein
MSHEEKEISRIGQEIRNHDLQNALDLLDKIEPFYILVIVLLGLFGNTGSFFLFVLTKLR